jgi:hypothetical protein
MIKNLKEKHLFTCEEKLKFLGQGEWVNEPDEVTFDYNGYRCQILRIFVQEPYAKEEHWFGGYLCGYVYIPNDHIYFGKDYHDMSIDCHGGLTYSEYQSDNSYKIGFDCGHCMDYLPSMDHLKKTLPSLIAITEKYAHLKKDMEDHYLFNPSYKNIEFCMKECASIVDQLIDIKNSAKNVV